MKPQSKQISIWTRGYRPFVLGGDVNYVLRTTVPVLREFKYRGVELVVVENTLKGGASVVEKETGGIVQSGASADEACKNVIADLKTATPAEIKAQIAEAAAWMNGRGARTVEPAEFWKMIAS